MSSPSPDDAKAAGDLHGKAADEVFLALELAPGGLTGITGVVRYGPEFEEV